MATVPWNNVPSVAKGLNMDDNETKICHKFECVYSVGNSSLKL